MFIKLPDGTKAQSMGVTAGKTTKILLEDGSVKWYPTAKLTPWEEQEEELQIRVIPAIERLEELRQDVTRLNAQGVGVDPDSFDALVEELSNEALQQFKDKWGL